jgi:hypothetical protein
MDILLDDYNRKEEKEIVDLWLNDLERLGFGVERVVRKMEKGACLLKVTARN